MTSFYRVPLPVILPILPCCPLSFFVLLPWKTFKTSCLFTFQCKSKWVHVSSRNSKNEYISISEKPRTRRRVSCKNRKNFKSSFDIITLISSFSCRHPCPYKSWYMEEEWKFDRTLGPATELRSNSWCQRLWGKPLMKKYFWDGPQLKLQYIWYIW